MTGRRMTATVAVAVTLAAIAIGGTGCGSDSQPRTAGPTGATGVTGPAEPGPTARVCTEIGCNSGVFADLSKLRSAEPSVDKVELCLGSTCDTFTREEFSYAGVVNRRLKGEGLRRATLVGFDESGNVVLRDSLSAPSVRSQPNGPDCPPVCFSVQVRVDPEGRLVR